MLNKMSSLLRILFVLLIVGLISCEEAFEDAEEADISYNIPSESKAEEERLQEKRSLPVVTAYNGNPGTLIDPYYLPQVGEQLIGQLVEVTNQVAVPIITHRNVPVPYPQPVPVPVQVPIRIPHPVPVPVYKTVPVPVDKPIIVPKPYPVKVIKEIPVPVPKPVPFPVYKTKHIYHIAIPKNDW